MNQNDPPNHTTVCILCIFYLVKTQSFRQIILLNCKNIGNINPCKPYKVGYGLPIFRYHSRFFLCEFGMKSHKYICSYRKSSFFYCIYTVIVRPTKIIKTCVKPVHKQHLCTGPTCTKNLGWYLTYMWPNLYLLQTGFHFFLRSSHNAKNKTIKQAEIIVPVIIGIQKVVNQKIRKVKIEIRKKNQLKLLVKNKGIFKPFQVS